MTRYFTEQQIRILSPQLLQMELSDRKMSLTEMAREMGMTLYRVRTMRESEHYQNLLAATTRKQVNMAERTLKNRTLEIREKLSNYTSEAVETLYAMMRNEQAPYAVRKDCATEILDRDGRFAKVSRLMNVQQGQDGAPMLPEDAAAEIVDALAR